MSALICHSASASGNDRPADLAVRAVRVLHLINGEHYSGAERVQDLLALRLGEFGYEVGFAGLKLDRFAPCRQSHETPLFDLPMHSRVDIAPAWAVARLIRRHEYRIVHTHTPRAALVGRLAAALTRVPVVHHMHSPTAADSTHRWRNRFNVAIERWSLAHVAQVITVSHSLAEYARRVGFDPRRIRVVPNGVPIAGPLVRRSTPRGLWTLGTVALFRPRKGLEVLLQAMALSRAQGLPVRLRAVGRFETCDYEATIRNQAERLGLNEHISWVGFARDVPAELKQMDLFVLPSLFGEGLPMVVLEAMASGVPVVATRVEGIPEAIRDRRDGLIVSPDDPPALTAAMAAVIGGEIDWQSLRDSAHRRQADLFSDRSMAQGVASVYQQVLGQ